MEHRWGERIELELPVRLTAGSLYVAHGTMLNVGLSGVFVATSEPVPPPQASIDVEYDLMRSRGSKSYRVAGYLVRRTDSGIALEWCEFAPRTIRALMALARLRVMRQARAGRLAAVGHPKRGLPAASHETHTRNALIPC